ncbi:hypothetical protein [Paraburkholderia caribensis]|uniref:hypothetical protein n=1 Tax=Paraburkholderia caribensis TaxID=75105 RepID=UPI002856A791|nr:hypothetical protein [Paraburkholderia caribensis]MDR6380476.1 hypothetical protein [Paraburkholderia caribensis]
MQWNTLDVPLENGWKCRLYPARQYRRLARELRGAELYGGSVSRTRDGSASFTIDDRQRELDRRDFDLHFRPRPDLRTVTGKRELDVIRSFLRDLLDVAHWNRPADNEGIEKALREAVASGRLVPVIDRERRALARVTRPDCAPERWASSSSGLGNAGGFGLGKWAAFVDAGPGPLMLNGEPVLRGPYDPATREAQLKAAWAEMANGAGRSGDALDLLGAARAIAGGMVAAESDEDAVPSFAKGISAATGIDDSAKADSSPPGDAQPFGYYPDKLSDETTEVAARGVRLSGNDPGGFRINPNGLDVDYFDDHGNLCAQYHESHGPAHGHNFDNGVRDNSHVSMSPINCR